MAKNVRRSYRTPVKVERYGSLSADNNDFTPDGPDWNEVFSDRGRFEGMRGSEQVEAQQLHGGAATKMFCRWSTRWQSANSNGLRHRVRTDSEVFAIKSIVNVDQMGREAMLVLDRTTEDATA